MDKLQAVFWLIVFIVLILLLILLTPFVLFIAIFFAVFASDKYKQWGVNCWEGFDNFGSAILGGDPDESISSRLGKARRAGSRLTFVANKVDLVADDIFNDVNHCNKSIEADEGRKQVSGR